MHVRVCAMTHVWGQRACRSWLSPSTLWVLGWNSGHQQQPVPLYSESSYQLVDNILNIYKQNDHEEGLLLRFLIVPHEIAVASLTLVWWAVGLRCWSQSWKKASAVCRWFTWRYHRQQENSCILESQGLTPTKAGPEKPYSKLRSKIIGNYLLPLYEIQNVDVFWDTLAFSILNPVTAQWDFPEALQPSEKASKASFCFPTMYLCEVISSNTSCKTMSGQIKCWANMRTQLFSVLLDSEDIGKHVKQSHAS